MLLKYNKHINISLNPSKLTKGYWGIYLKRKLLTLTSCSNYNWSWSWLNYRLLTRQWRLLYKELTQ